MADHIVLNFHYANNKECQLKVWKNTTAKDIAFNITQVTSIERVICCDKQGNMVALSSNLPDGMHLYLNKSFTSKPIMNDDEKKLDWANDTLLDLTNGSGGGDNDTAYYASNGVVVTSTAAVCYKTSQTWHLYHAFNGKVDTNPALLLYPVKEQESLTFIFKQPMKVSKIHIYPTLVSRPSYFTNYSIEIFVNNKWDKICDTIDTIKDKIGYKRAHQIRKQVTRIRVNLFSTTHKEYHCLQEIDIFVLQ
eukprot:291169_1